uniref:Nitro_FeMo-Co domain-containing protein n=1 Tax=Loa loa TaxID=7209 RepID=A0A1I7VDP0_LOALO
MSLTSLYQSFPVFFFIVNESSVRIAGSPHFDKRIVLSGGANNNSVLEVSDGITIKRVHRDVGLLSTPFVGAFVTGIIGELFLGREKRHVRVKKDAESVIEAVLHGIIGTLVISFHSGCCK